MTHASEMLRGFTAMLLILGGCMGASGDSAPATPAVPEGVLVSLPALHALPAVPAPSKAASDIDIDLLATLPVAQSATGVSYTWGNLALTPPDSVTMAYAVFGASLPADGAVYPMRLSVAADAQYWVAISDYARQRWEFLPYQSGGSYLLSGGAGLLRQPDGALYVALIGWQAPVNITSAVLTTNEVPGRPLQLWYYLQTNLQVAANLDTEIARLPVAAAAGYTKVLYADTKLEYIDQASDTYLNNLQAFSAAARANGIEVIPNLLAVGYADGLLIHDPNLIEGQPVKDCLFTVNSGQAQAVQDPGTVIVNGGFETHNGNQFPNWNQMDGAGVSTFADAGRTGSTSIRYSNYAGNDRITQTITVQPWQCYVVHFWLRTQNVAPVGQLWARIFSTDSEFRQLTYNTFPISATQDWQQYDLIFNSQDKTEVYLYLGIWGGESGQFWLDDVSIENTGLCNLIRRPGAPFKVTSADGTTVYTEGVDYQGIDGDTVTDPQMGHAGSWPGTYNLWHAPPVIVIPAGSRIGNGDQLRVSYYHAAFTDDMKAALAIAEEDTLALAENLLRRIHEVLDPRTVFIAVDEHRVGGWSEPGFSAGTTTGQLLAQFTTQVDQLAHSIDPTWHLATWSDMYDPYHNMTAKYYLCRGGTENAVAGLPAGWDIANWNFFSQVPENLAHFSARGNRQVLSGYYDQGANITIADWLEQARDVPGVYAVMYTTWRADYSQLGNFAQVVRDWEALNP